MKTRGTVVIARGTVVITRGTVGGGNRKDGGGVTRVIVVRDDEGDHSNPAIAFQHNDAKAVTSLPRYECVFWGRCTFSRTSSARHPDAFGWWRGARQAHWPAGTD